MTDPARYDLETPEGRAQAEAAAVNAAAAGSPTVKIGVVTPLSGPGDPTAGELSVRGAVIGAEYVLEHGGIKDGTQIELVVRNDQETVALDGGTMPRSAVGAFAKVALIDEVLAVLGPWHLRTADRTADAAERLGVPLFIESADPRVTANKRRMVFRTFTSIAERVPILVDFLAAHGMRRVSILAADTVFGLTCADTFEQAAAAAPGEPFDVQRFDFPQEATDDVRPELRKIQEFGPDVILNIGVIRSNHMILQQAAEVGLLPGTPMLATFQWPLRSADFWRQAGDAGNFLVWPASQFSPTWSGLTEIGHWFVRRYTEKYGMLPPDTALNTFTDVTIIAQALEAMDGPDVPSVADGCREQLVAMLESRAWNTWRGPVAFTRGDTHWHHSPPPVVLQQYQEVGQDISNLAIVYPPEHATHAYIRPGGPS